MKITVEFEEDEFLIPEHRQFRGISSQVGMSPEEIVLFAHTLCHASNVSVEEFTATSMDLCSLGEDGTSTDFGRLVKAIDKMSLVTKKDMQSITYFSTVNPDSRPPNVGWAIEYIGQKMSKDKDEADDQKQD